MTVFIPAGDREAWSEPPEDLYANETIRVTGEVASACPADLDGDGSVGSNDLAILLSGWGAPGAGDLDGSGEIDAADLATLLAGWGACAG